MGFSFQHKKSDPLTYLDILAIYYHNKLSYVGTHYSNWFLAKNDNLGRKRVHVEY